MTLADIILWSITAGSAAIIGLLMVARVQSWKRYSRKHRELKEAGASSQELIALTDRKSQAQTIIGFALITCLLAGSGAAIGWIIYRIVLSYIG